MQLNNLINGRIAIIDKIDFYQNLIVYSTCEFGLIPISQSKHIPAQSLKDLLSQTVNCENSCLQILKTEVLTDFEISTDVKNWTVIKGSTGIDTTIRVFIPANVLVQVLNTGNDLDLLIKSMEPLASFAVRDISGSMQYLEELHPEHRAILEQYPEIIIQEKF
jgi:hypothetical protein